MKTHFPIPLSILLLTIIVISQFVHASSDLSLTVMVNKPTSFLGENVEINGTLTLFGIPILNGFVAIQVDYPSPSGCLTIRTCDTGMKPSTPVVEILQLFPSDAMGNPKSSFPRGTSDAYFTIKWRNNDDIGHYVTIVLAFYNVINAPFLVWTPVEGLMYPGEENGTFQLTIPDTAMLGETKVYGNVVSGWPKNGGYAYGPEKSATFSITASSSAMSKSQTLTQMTEEGTYDLTFYLPTNQRAGTYTVYVGSCYAGHQATNTTTFEANARLFCDITGDGVVDGQDVILVIEAVPSYPGHPKWNPAADVNYDGVVDGSDTVLVIENVGQHI